MSVTRWLTPGNTGLDAAARIWASSRWSSLSRSLDSRSRVTADGLTVACAGALQRRPPEWHCATTTSDLRTKHHRGTGW